MDVCQSGFHDQELQKRLVKVPVEGGQNVILCDFCLSRIMEAQQQGGDLTMTILYQWARECGDIPKLPDSLKLDCMNRCHLVQFVNQQLLKIRTTSFAAVLFITQHFESPAFVYFLRRLKFPMMRQVPGLTDPYHVAKVDPFFHHFASLH